MVSNPARVDPIRSKYYRPLERAEAIASWLFYLGAAFSLAPLIVDKQRYATPYSAVLVTSVLLVVSIFILGLATRLYFAPRAADARRREFLSNAFGIDLTHDRTAGYYNNDEAEPLPRMGMAVLENAFFSKSILLTMLPGERARVAVYVALWLLLALWRDTPLDWIATSAQVLFSEEIIAKWLRMESLRMRCEHVYQDVYRLYQSKPDPKTKAAMAVDAFGDYETAKAAGCITLSSRLFEKLNPSLTEEWSKIRAALRL